jgi:hypothetical protein
MLTTLSQNGVGVLFFNTQAEDYFKGAQVSNLSDADMDAVCHGETRVLDCFPWTVKNDLFKLYWKQRSQPICYPIVVFIDEAQLVCPRGAFVFPDGEPTPDDIFGVICTAGRRWNMRIVWICPRPQFADPGIYRSARMHIFFTVDPADVIWLKREAGITMSNPEWFDYVVVMT